MFRPNLLEDSPELVQEIVQLIRAETRTKTKKSLFVDSKAANTYLKAALGKGFKGNELLESYLINAPDDDKAIDRAPGFITKYSANVSHGGYVHGAKLAIAEYFGSNVWWDSGSDFLFVCHTPDPKWCSFRRGSLFNFYLSPSLFLYSVLMRLRAAKLSKSAYKSHVYLNATPEAHAFGSFDSFLAALYFADLGLLESLISDHVLGLDVTSYFTKTKLRKKVIKILNIHADNAQVSRFLPHLVSRTFANSTHVNKLLKEVSL